MEHEQQEGLLGWLDGPRIIIAGSILYAFLVSILLLVLWDDLREQVDRTDVLVAARLEEARAADRDAVNRCFSAAAQGPPLRRALLQLEAEAESAATREALTDLRRLNQLNAPTVLECRRLAERLNVNVPRGVR